MRSDRGRLGVFCFRLSLSYSKTAFHENKPTEDVATHHNDANPMVPVLLGALILLFSGDSGPDFIPDFL